MTGGFRDIPSVDRVLSDPGVVELRARCDEALLVRLVRRYLAELRSSISAGARCPPMSDIVDALTARVDGLLSSSLRPVVNATGIIVHTNLGRAPLSPAAMDAMEAEAEYCSLEFDLETGRRGSRTGHAQRLVRELTGAEAALVVNNNAAAVLLALSALARRKEVLVSRGQSVQIGGGFRVPDVMRQSGAKLVDVGTTNCTYLRDYEEAITARTAAIMRVHSSNFRLSGFTHQVGLDELVDLGNRYGVPVLDDLGSGCLLDTSPFGLQREPMMQHSITAGASLVFSSGDKLLGGPQAGIVVGRKELVDKLQRHPLARALRIDKLRLGGLIATLAHYARGDVLSSVPVWRMISASLEDLNRRAQSWAESCRPIGQVIEGETMVGGGSLPGSTLPTRLLAVRHSEESAETIARRLRRRVVPVIPRISEGVLLLDPRTVLPEQDGMVERALSEVVKEAPARVGESGRE